MKFKYCIYFAIFMMSRVSSAQLQATLEAQPPGALRGGPTGSATARDRHAAGFDTVRDETEGASPFLLIDDFESGEAGPWELTQQFADGTINVVAGGHLSDRSVELTKPDAGGRMMLSRTVDLAAGGELELRLEVKTIRLEPFADFWTQVDFLDEAGEMVLEGSPQPFYDGRIEPNRFGGLFKGPQTLGHWVTHRHALSVPDNATKAVVQVVLAGGPSSLRIDTVRLVPRATEESPADYAVEIRSAGVAELDVDEFTPGFVYQLRALTDAREHAGMGVLMQWTDVGGRVSDPVDLSPVRFEDRTIIYEFQAPMRAVRLHFSLHNDDLQRFAPGTRPDQYRHWRRLEFRVVRKLPITDIQYLLVERGQTDDADQGRPRGVVRLDDFKRQALQAHMLQREALPASVVEHKGGQAILLGETVVPPVFASHTRMNDFDVYSALFEQGVRFIKVNNQPGGPPLSGQWPAEGAYDFSGIDEVVYLTLKQAPDAHLIFEIGGAYPPPWWGLAHPDELLRDASGNLLLMRDHRGAVHRYWGTDPQRMLDQLNDRYANWTRTMRYHEPATFFPSPASTRYREAMKDYLVALRRHIESQPYGRAVVGYKIEWGYDTQWGWPMIGAHDRHMQSGGAWQPGPRQVYRLDYSEPMRLYFQRFLRDRYRNNVALLRAAWGDDQATFESARIPVPEERVPRFSQVPAENVGLPFVLDPAENQRTIDWNTAYAEVVGSLLNDLAQAVKEAHERPVLIQAYFQDYRRALGADDVVAAPWLDITGGPSYQAREIGQPGINPHYRNSWQRQGKLDFVELDHRLFPIMYRAHANNQVFASPRRSIAILEREFARQIVHAGGWWTYDMAYGWYTHPILAETVGRGQRAYERSLGADRSSVAKVALFFGDTPYHAMSLPGSVTARRVLAEQLMASLGTAGVPFDQYRMADLPEVGPAYDVLIFPHAFALSDAERHAIEQVKNNNRLLVFGPAAGLVGDSESGAHLSSQLIGMTMRRDDSLPRMLRVVNRDHPVSRELPTYIGSDSTGEQQVRINFPKLYVDDPNAVPLSRFADESMERTGMAWKEHGNWQSLYLGTIAHYPGELLRGIARQKGIHIYNEQNDIIFAAANLIAIHAASQGEKVIHLPEPMRVTSLWDDVPLGVLQTIRRPMQTGDTALYRLENPPDPR